MTAQGHATPDTGVAAEPRTRVQPRTPMMLSHLAYATPDAQATVDFRDFSGAFQQVCAQVLDQSLQIGKQ